MTAYEQRSYPGAAADTLLNADITSGAASFSVTPGSGTGYPDGSAGPFFVIIDWDNSKAEKIRCSGRVNDTFTVAGTGGGRGQDGTSAIDHKANARVRAVITATDIQEANRAAAQTIGKVTSKGDLLTGSGANTLVRTAAGANGTLIQFDSTQPGGVKATAQPTIGDFTSAQHNHEDAASGGVLQGEAWASWTPGIQGTGWALGNATVIGQYRQVGRVVHFSLSITWGSTSTFGAGPLTIGQPGGGPGSNVANINASALDTSASQRYGLDAFSPAGGAGIGVFLRAASGAWSGVTSTVPFTWAATDQLFLSGTYQSSTSAYA